MTDAQNQPGGSDSAQQPGGFTSQPGPAGPVAGTDLAIGPGVPVGSLILGILATILLALCGVGLLVVLIFRKARRETGANPGADLLAGLRQLRQMRNEMKRDQ